jgi:invasion protein IalB
MPINSFKTGLFTVIVSILATMPLQSEAKDKIQNFKDWARKCEKPQGAKEKICFIFQQVSSGEDDKILADAAITYLPKAKKPVMIITLPLGVFLPAGIMLKIDDDNETAQAPFLQCINIGCRTRLQLTDKLITKMKGGNKMIVAFYTQEQKQLAFPISLRGFTAAIGSIKK